MQSGSCAVERPKIVGQEHVDGLLRWNVEHHAGHRGIPRVVHPHVDAAVLTHDLSGQGIDLPLSSHVAWHGRHRPEFLQASWRHA